QDRAVQREGRVGRRRRGGRLRQGGGRRDQDGQQGQQGQPRRGGRVGRGACHDWFSQVREEGCAARGRGRRIADTITFRKAREQTFAPRNGFFWGAGGAPAAAASPRGHAVLAPADQPDDHHGRHKGQDGEQVVGRAAAGGRFLC